MILDLTVPLTENFAYKNPSQREAWGSLPSLWSHYYVELFSRVYLEKSFLRGKKRTDPDLIYQLGKSYLRSSKLLTCWNQLGGIWIETGNGSASWLGGMG